MVEKISPTCKENLRVLADAYCKATGVSLTTVSRYATSDGDTLSRLRRKKSASITVRKYDDAIAWLTDPKVWPEGTSPPALIDPRHTAAA